MGMKPYKDLTGQKFSEITVETVAGKDKRGRSLWNCKCSCGKSLILTGNAVSSGNTKSCGCKHREYMVRALGIQTGELTGAYYSKTKGRAGLLGTPFSVSREYLSELFESQNRKCKLSGMDIVLNAPMGKGITASLDQIEPSKGYVPGNVQWLHKSVNFMKQRFSQQEFISICKKIANNNP